MLCLFYLLVVQVTKLRAAAIIEAPVGQIVLLGESPVFECRAQASGRAPYWLINGTQFTRNLHRKRGIDRILLRQTGPSEYLSRLQINATETNNNTELKCGVLDVESPQVFLRIQGFLESPSNLTAVHINSSTTYLTWSAPHTLGEPDILMYNIIIKDAVLQEIILTTNSTVNEYYFGAFGDYCPLKTYAVCVAAVNGLGVGYFGDPVVFVHGFLNLNISGTSSQFACESLCDDSLLVTWLINGRFLSQLGNQLFSVRMGSNYSECDSAQDTYTTTLEVVTKTLTPYTVQCVAMVVCIQGDETAPCSSDTCYSCSIHVEDDDGMMAPLSTTTTDLATVVHTITTGMEHDTMFIVTIGSAAGISAVTICFFLLIIVCVMCCRKMFKRSKAVSVVHLSNTNSEVIYEQCGDPITTTKKGVIYDCPVSPSPSVTQICVAYAASPQPTTDPNIAYAVRPVLRIQD